MIRELFLPPLLGSRRIFGQRILGLSVQENSVTAAVVYAGVSGTKVELLTQRDLPENVTPQIISDTIKELCKDLPKPQIVRISLPASMVIFKELSVPFLDRERISMVLGYEVEPLIPFALEEAVFSFVVTQQNTTEATSQVFTAAARIVDVESHILPYTEAKIIPDAITVDLVSLYGLYKQIPDYTKLPHATVLVILNERSTRIAFIANGQLRLIRNIAKGFETIAFGAAHEMKKDPQETLMKLYQRGCIEDLHPIVEKHIVNFMNDIQFTINSFGLQLQIDETIDMILFSGRYATVPSFVDFASNLLQIPCEIFTPEKILSQKGFSCGKQVIPTSWSVYAVALGTALPYQPQQQFDLTGSIFADRDNNKTYRSLVAACCMILIGSGIVIGNGIMHLQELHDLNARIERTELARLAPLLAEGGKRTRTTTLKRAQQIAETALTTKEEIWASLNKEGVKPLEVLYELTKLIDKKRFDINIESADLSTEDGPLTAQISGVFRSKSGSDHFTHFADFEKRFSDSKILALETLSESLTDDGSVRFSSLFKVRES